MDYQIIWSSEAQDEIRAILDFLLDNWGDTVADRFSDQIFQVSANYSEAIHCRSQLKKRR